MGPTCARGWIINRDRVQRIGGAAGFTEWLRAQLKARKLSQRQLAQRSGVDHSSISRLVRGDRMPSLETAMKVARGLDPELDLTGRPVAAELGRNPAAGVEYALRADDHLSEADVRDIMLYYLAARRHRAAKMTAQPTMSAPRGRRGAHRGP